MDKRKFSSGRCLIVTVGLTLVFFSLAQAAQAASLYFSPSSGSFAPNQIFSVGIYVSSPTQALNAVDGVVSFPTSKLEVTSLSKGGSILNLWVKEPSFSNSAGSVSFEGVVLNPGFIGSVGRVITVNFRAKGQGSAPVVFTSGSVLANDGRGTNILSGFGNANYFIGTATPQVPTPSEPEEFEEEGLPSANLPEAPNVSSPTHPDPNKWYSLNTAKFTWPLPSGITGARLVYGRNPQSSPFVSYIPPVSSKEISNLGEGVWYFHAQLRNSKGWGKVARFRFQIDTQKPEQFDVNEVDQPDSTEPRRKFTFIASDSTSGVDHYEVQIDDKGTETWKDDGSHVYETPVLGPGSHVLKARAVDRAGNSLEQSREFAIGALEPPKIISYSREVKRGESFTVKGLTYPQSQVVLSLKKQSENGSPLQYTVTSTDNGEFNFAIKKLKAGTYTFWAEVINDKGARSNPSEKLTVQVKYFDFSGISSSAMKVLTVVIPIIALIILLVIVLWYGWHRLALLRHRMRRERGEIDLNSRKAFELLRNDVRKQISGLEKVKSKRRELTEEEEKIIEGLGKALNKAEGLIEPREVQDIK